MSLHDDKPPLAAEKEPDELPLLTNVTADHANELPFDALYNDAYNVYDNGADG